MFWSKITINRNEIAAKRLLTPYAWHMAVWEAFDKEKKGRDFIYHYDINDETATLNLISETKPSIPEWGAWQTKVIPEKLFDGTNYFFKIKVNLPPERVPGKHRNIIEWFRNQGKAKGFTLTDAIITKNPEVIKFGTNKKDDKRIFIICSTEIEGFFTISDRELFKEHFYKGFGANKTFGLGLMQLKQV